MTPVLTDASVLLRVPVAYLPLPVATLFTLCVLLIHGITHWFMKQKT
jgi:hypothetical protein